MRAGASALGAAALVVLLLWLALGTRAEPDLGRSGARDWSGDFRAYYLPNAEYLGARLARGELPLWNPHQGAGAPFLASLQVGALYPPNWLHALLPSQTAFAILAGLHLVLAVALAGGLAGALGAGPAGSALAGIAWAGSVQVVGGIWSPPVQYAAAWAPGVLLGVERVTTRPDARSAAGLAAALALGLLCGWPYAIAIAALGAAAYALLVLGARAIRQRRLPLRPLALLALGALAGLALAAPQLLPTAELLARSCRALGSLVEAQAIGGGVERPHDPALFASLLAARGYNDGVPGWPTLLFAGLALALPGPGRGRAAALLAVGGVGLLASFPHHTPVYGWLRELPLLADFRFPFRYRLLTCLALAVAAGVGLEHLRRRLARRPRLAWGAAGLGLALQLGLVAVPVFQRVLPFARSWPAPQGLAEELPAAAGVLPARGEGRVYWAERADRLRAPGSSLVLHDLEPMSLARTAELLTYFETGMPRTLLTLPRAAGDGVAPPFFGKLVLPAGGERARLLDLFSVRALVAGAPPAWLDQRFERVSGPGAEPAVFRNPHALPRAYRVGTARPEPPVLAAALRRLLAPDFDPRREVMLDSPPPGLRGRAPGAGGEPGRVEIASDAPERTLLRTDGSAPGVVVVTDAHFPGWEARLDGEPVPLLRANLGFRGVAVPPGSHEVELLYRPASLRRGAALAAGAALLLGGLAWRSPRASRR